MADTNLTRDLEEACHPDAPLTREWLAKLAHRALVAINATATPPADAALADVVDKASRSFRSAGMNRMADDLTKAAAALRARAVPSFDMKACHDFWAHYSSLNEGDQDELNGQRHDWLAAMLAASKEGK